MPLSAFFISSFRYVCIYVGFSSQIQSSWVAIFKEYVRIDLVQILYSTALQCVFPVLLFYPHTHDSVWTKIDYGVHITVFYPRPLPPLLRVRRVVVLGRLLRGPSGAEGQRVPPGSCRWCRGEAAPCRPQLTAHERRACFLWLFSAWI